jgi:biopolymer transport protein ExbB
VENFGDIYTLETDLTRHLTLLSIISSNAPYVGLLGTVAGVMVTFYDMGTGGGIDTNLVLVGLSLALKATALGLLVAIPSLMIYSACLRKVDVLVNEWKSLYASS